MGSPKEQLGRIVPILRDFTMPQEGKSTSAFEMEVFLPFLVDDDFYPSDLSCHCFFVTFLDVSWILHPGKQTWNLKMNPGKRVFCWKLPFSGSMLNFQGVSDSLDVLQN